MMTKMKIPAHILWLAAIGVIAILAANFGLSVLLGRSITEGLLQREGLVKQELLAGILAAEKGADSLFAQPAPSPALTSFSAHVRSLPGIVRANIYSPDGYIRHSTDANLVGVQFKDNEELAEAFGGKISSTLETTASSTKSEHLALGQMDGEALIEAYIPVPGPDGKIVTVVEFYRKDALTEQMSSEISRSMWIAAGISSAILVVLLLLAVRRRTK